MQNHDQHLEIFTTNKTSNQAAFLTKSLFGEFNLQDKVFTDISNLGKNGVFPGKNKGLKKKHFCLKNGVVAENLMQKNWF